MRIPRKRLETVNQYLKTETTSQKLRNYTIYAIRERQKYSHMNKVGYLNAHVKTIYHLNVPSTISKLHNTDLETTLENH